MLADRNEGDAPAGHMRDLRRRLVSVAVEWERAFGNAPSIAASISEFDAAMLLGMTEAEYSQSMQGSTAVQRGHDFVFRGKRIQVKATRPSGKPGSAVTNVPKARNYEWDELVWISYNPGYGIQEAWLWNVRAYEAAFRGIKRLSPADMRRGRSLMAR